jgi:hypothetical protein
MPQWFKVPYPFYYIDNGLFIYNPSSMCIFGVVTTDNLEQAIERCGTKAGNKGFDAAVAAIEMVNLLRATRTKR